MLRYIVLLTFLLVFVHGALAGTPKNVLILHEGSRLQPYQSVVSNELEKGLTSSKFDVQIFEEYLERWRLSQDLSRPTDALEAKYAGRKFDVVVADGSHALQLLINQPPDFLRGTPVVFVDVGDLSLPPSLPSNITGVTGHIDYAPTIRLAMRLQPGLQHVYYIESDPGFDEHISRVLDPEFAPFRNQLDIVQWRDVALDDLLNRVESLPPHSAVLFDAYFKDPSGKLYMSGEVGARIAARANAPTYTLYQTGVGIGPVGGVVVNFAAMGKQAAGIARALLAGEPVSKYPVERAGTEVMIDWRRFQQFGFSEADLPASAIVLFRPPTLWEKYHWYIIAAGVVILLQTVLIIELALAGKLRKRSERSARELAIRLISAQEEERRRIAGELHDDVSQRLALVAIHLDALRGSPPGSKRDLVRELSVLYDETDLISSDVHQFSHELHPAVLERLGLASALRRHCVEFSAHRKIAVDMSTIGNEPQMDPETALAFFRVGQECLMNAAKHSGATDCNVSLTYARRRITLAVKDNGSGFDTKDSPISGGLGIQSMRERLRSIGGSLRIQSSLLQGTTVFAEAALAPAADSYARTAAREESPDSRSAAEAF